MSDDAPANMASLEDMWTTRTQLTRYDDGVVAWLSVLAEEFGNHPNLDRDMVTDFVDTTLDDDLRDRPRFRDETGHSDADLIHLLTLVERSHVYVDQHRLDPHELVLSAHSPSGSGLLVVVIHHEDTTMPVAQLADRLAHVVTTWIEEDDTDENN